MGEALPGKPYWKRVGTDFPRRLRQSEARLHLACPRLPRAPYGRGAGGESDPHLLAAGAPRGRAKGDRGRDTLCPPAGRSLSPQRSLREGGNAEDLDPGCPAQLGFDNAGLRASASDKTPPCLASCGLSFVDVICPRNWGRYTHRREQAGVTMWPGILRNTTS